MCPAWNTVALNFYSPTSYRVLSGSPDETGQLLWQSCISHQAWTCYSTRTQIVQPIHSYMLMCS